MTRRQAGLRAVAAALCLTALMAASGGAGQNQRADAALPVTPVEDLPRPGIVVMDSDVNNRNVDSGIQRGADGNVYVWGRTGRGVDGVYSADTIGPNEREWPRKVMGLPEGGIAAVSAGIYNFNALDTAGHVWGWGAYSAARDGTSSTSGRDNRLACLGMSVKPVRLRVGSAWDGSGPLLSGVTQITGTEMAGAAVTADGAVYRWGRQEYGGNPGVEDGCSKKPGAQAVEGLPDPSVPGNFPVYIKGGYQTFWVILENGDVWFWGGGNKVNKNERPRAVDGGNPDKDDETVHVAQKSVALGPWMRSNSSSAHIVLVDSGINLGGALLSDGRVLTWGTDRGRVGDREGWAEAPGLLPTMTDVVHLAYTFTGGAMITSDGSLYGYGADSYECFPTSPGGTGCSGGPRYDTVPGLLDTDVTTFAVGQGHIRWTKAVTDPSAANGVRLEVWGQGYNPRAAIGHPRGTVSGKRLVTFRTNGNQLCTQEICDLATVLRKK